MSRFRHSLPTLILLFTALSLAAGDRQTEVPEGFVDVEEVVPYVQVEIRYAGRHNFVGEPIDGYEAPRCFLTREAAEALRNVQIELLSLGLSLKIYDGYRPQRAVDHFVRWARDLSDTTLKAEFYPDVAKKHLFRDGYISSRSGHSRGSTVDLTIVPLPSEDPAEFTPGDTLCDCRAPVAQRFPDASLDMGSGWDCFDPLSHTANPEIGGQQRANRLLLKSLMEKYGFRNYSKEWWHFTLKNEPFPDTYFDFLIR